MRRVLFWSSLFALGIVACNRENLVVTPNVDLDRFQGKWHEIAHLARSTQNDCTGTTATYTRESDGKPSFVHECTLKGGRYHGATAVAEVPDPKTPGEMEVDSPSSGMRWTFAKRPEAP